MAKRASEPLDLKVDRLATPVGELLIVADGEGRLRTIDWTDHEARMRQLLDRYYGMGRYSMSPARDPDRVQRCSNARRIARALTRKAWATLPIERAKKLMHGRNAVPSSRLKPQPLRN